MEIIQFHKRLVSILEIEKLTYVPNILKEFVSGQVDTDDNSI